MTTKKKTTRASDRELSAAAVTLGRRGGQAKSPRKTAAVRENAKLGAAARWGAQCRGCGQHPAAGTRLGARLCVACLHLVDVHHVGLPLLGVPDPCEATP